MCFALLLLAQTFFPLRVHDSVPEPPARVESTPRAGRVAVKWYTLSLVGTAPANGDDDGYADADETLDMTLTLVNGPVALTNLVVTLQTSDATIECVHTPQVTIASVAPGATITTPPFRFKVAGPGIVDRTDIDQKLNANFGVAMRSDQFDVLDRPAELTLPLDLDLAGGAVPTTFVEDFEVANGPSGLGKFVLSTLDAGKNSLAASDGMRCQYNDPDAPNTQSAGNRYCFLGFPGEPDTNDWHLHTNSAANGGVGRAYTGAKSLHWGLHVSTTPAGDTTRLKQLDAVDSIIINLQSSSSHPELTFEHQVSLTVAQSVTVGETDNRAIVEVNALNPNGTEGPVWERLEPYWNRYDSVGEQDYSNCIFDPTDDGNDEDSYYDPTDPNRRFGPSSTCYGQRVFAQAGDTDYHNAADPAKIGWAGDGPGVQGSINVGTWVRPAFNLQRYAGRRIKIRLLATTIEILSMPNNYEFLGHRDSATDDGWYVDDVRLTSTLASPATISPDSKAVTPLPCVPCGSINAALTVAPVATPHPGAVVTLDASGTAIDACLMGPPRYQFWVDQNANGIVGDGGDVLLRDFSDLPTLLVAPDTTQQVGVVAACPGEPLCDVDGSATAVATITVDCPPGVARSAFGQTLYVDKGYGYYSTKIHWAAARAFSYVRGCLFGSCNGGVSLRGTGTFTGTIDKCVASAAAADTVIDPGSDDPTPLRGNNYFYLVRGRDETCGGVAPGYTSNDSSERAGRDAAIDADAVAGTCP